MHSQLPKQLIYEYRNNKVYSRAILALKVQENIFIIFSGKRIKPEMKRLIHLTTCK